MRDTKHYIYVGFRRRINMTYCVAMRLKDGMVFVSDTRTNAGVDHISTFRKLFYFQGENREITIQSAGNLATTQSVIAKIKADIESELDNSILKLKSMYQIAEIVGSLLREVVERDKSELIDASQLSSSILIGGYIKGREPELFNIYPEGNFIISCKDTPYFQIGEIKYGKPILDRIVKFDTDITDALKCAMISFDSTIKSNLSVGLPIDILVMDFKKQKTYSRRLDSTDPYMMTVRNTWGQLIKEIFNRVPDLELSAQTMEDYLVKK